MNKTKGKKTKSIILTILVVLFIFFAQCPYTFFLKDTDEDYSHILKNVYDYNNSFGNVPVSEIAMLGSHDSLSSEIGFMSLPDKTRTKQRHDNFASNPFLYILTHGASIRLARAQNKNVADQLKAGSRYLDFRITDIDGVFYNSHGLLADRYENNLLRVLEFLDNNPGEFIIINILYYYYDSKTWDDLCDFMSNVKYNGKCIFDYVNYDTNAKDFSSITYNSLTNNGKKAGVLFISDEYDGSKYNTYFSLHNVYNHGCEEANYKKIDSVIEQHIFEASKLGNGYLKVNQTQITPNVNGLFSVLVNWSLLRISDKHNKIVLQDSFENWLEDMPIYLTDGVTSSANNFNHRANDIIIDYNKKLADSHN